VNPWNLPARLRRRLTFERAERRLDLDFQRLMASAARAYECRTARSPGPKVGIATFGSGNWHLILEVLLAHSLALRGASPELLVCDIPTLPVCDERTCFDRDTTSCLGCLPAKRPILDRSGLSWRGLSTYVAEGALERAHARVESLRDDELAGFRYGSWPLGEWTFVSACHFLRRDARTREPEHSAARRRFLTTGIVVVDAVERWLDESKLDALVVESGAHFMWRIAFELARARGIRVVCREIGKGGFDHHIYSVNAECMFPDWNEVWSAAKGIPLTASQERDVDAYLRALPAKTYAPDETVDDSRGPTRQTLGIENDSRLVVLFTNVTWDLATAGRDLAFDGMFDWLSETLAVAERCPKIRFVIRVHPAEEHVLTKDRVLDWLRTERPRLPVNVTTIASGTPASVRALTQMADLVLTYCSTTGIEAAIYGKPIIVAGAPHYRGKGFTIDVQPRNEYQDAFARLLQGELQPPPHASALAKRYFHLFFIRYHIPMRWTTSPLEPPFALTMKELSELLPGRNRAVDVVCAGILEGREILL
jgi:capsular polysaccharide biosynthesis protein